MSIYLYEHDGKFPESFEVEVAGELNDNTWIKLFQWAVPKDVHAAIALIPRLLATWEFIANS